MEKNVKWWGFLLMGLLYLVLVFASCFIGFLHPVCWAYYSVLAALLASGAYFWLASRWRKFGVGTICSLLVCLFCAASGEAGGVLSKVIILGCGIISDIVRSLIGNSSKKGLYWAYPILSVGNIGWIIRLWTDPDWYYQGAIDEMGEAYAEGIKALQSPWHLVAAVVITGIVAYVAIRLCAKANPGSADSLK